MYVLHSVGYGTGGKFSLKSTESLLTVGISKQFAF